MREVLPGNTTDKTTRKSFLAKIENQCGKADRIWVMDRGISTEETLAIMRSSGPPVSYLVGTPKGKLSDFEKKLAERDWKQARTNVRVKLLPHDGETYVLAESEKRIDKERAMRRRRLRKLIDKLRRPQSPQTPTQTRRHEPSNRSRKEGRWTRRTVHKNRNKTPRQKP